jgi:hypothetical protein
MEQVIEEKKLSDEAKQLLLDHEQVLAVLNSRRKLRGMDFYIPNPIQFSAHKSTAKTIAMVMGNRGGKSTMGAMEICWAVTKKYPEWYPQSRRFNRPVKIRIATDRFFKIDSVIEPKLREYLPSDEIVQVRRSPQGYINKMQTRDGSTIEFLTMEQDLMAFEGQDLDIFWGDEPIERKRYIATQRGLIDRGGQTILTFTPLIEPWMKEEIVDKADGKVIEIFTAGTRENKFDIKGNPILREADIQRFEDMLTDDEKETRIHGRFYHLKGLVYKEFNPVIHCINNFKYETNYPVICVLDPHDRVPHHVLWAMIDRLNDVYVMYEMIREGTIAELASYIKATETYFSWNVVKRLIDPNFGRKPLLSTGMSVIDELHKYRCSFTEADDNKEGGRLKVKEYLHYNQTKPIDINNKPKLFFVKDKCPRTIHSIQNYQYDEWRGNVDKDPKEESKQKDTHGADAVRYLIISRPEFNLPQAYEREGAYY